MVFNWVPTRNLFIADPLANGLVVLDITDNGVTFSATRREIRSEALDRPIDLAPTAREISQGSFASNTTLAGGSDLYILNRGNNSIVRMSINGQIRGVRKIDAQVPGFRVNGLAVSSDGQSIYITATAPGANGVLLSVPAFGGAESSSQFFSQATQSGQATNMSTFSKFLFTLKVTPAQGLGPLFNDQSCAGCHSSPFPGGEGLLTGQDEHLVGTINSKGVFDNLNGHGGPVARAHSVAELGVPCDLRTGIPNGATIVGLRNAMALLGDGLIDTIAQGDVIANMAFEPAAVRGRLNLLPDGRMGKFGWKANVPTLIEFMGDAFRNEMGITNPLQPGDELEGCHANANSPEVDALTLQAAAKFLNTIDPPAPTPTCTGSSGAQLFETIGCANCHTPSLAGPGARLLLPLYSDLLIHDMGPALNDSIQQGSAQGNEFRTAPLWRVSERSKFLHDGRATNIRDAIAAHGGQAQSARDAFQALASAAQDALLAFLDCI